MDDDSSFRDRVQKVFGSLSSSQSLWSLTDDEIEKREWRHGGGGKDDDLTPCSSSFEGLFSKKKSRLVQRNELEDDLEDLDGDNDDEQLDGGGGHGDVSANRDVWEIRSSIGLDTTLDNEEEEDEYDKVAEGRENAGDRLYMSNITDHGPHLNSYYILPDSTHDAGKDPRANHFAAKMRLEEDEAESVKFGPPTMPHSKRAEDGGKLKPILKKNNSAASRGQRRVRFDPYCKKKPEDGNPTCLSAGAPALATTVSDYESWVKSSAGVPDYVLNPSKYTRYSFDQTGEDGDESNSLKMPNPDESGLQLEDEPLHPPKSIRFTPRKKASCATPMDSSTVVEEEPMVEDYARPMKASQTGVTLGIAAGENQSGDDMDTEDETGSELQAMRTDSQRQARHYRARLKLDEDVS